MFCKLMVHSIPVLALVTLAVVPPVDALDRPVSNGTEPWAVNPEWRTHHYNPHLSRDFSRYQPQGRSRFGDGNRFAEFTERLQQRELLRNDQLRWQNAHRRGYGWGPNYNGMRPGHMGEYTPWGGVGFGIDLSPWKDQLARQKASRVPN